MARGVKKIGKDGQALVEFAFCIIFLILLVLGFAELGSALWTAHAVTNASREGARAAVTCEGLIENDPRVQQIVRNYLEKASLNVRELEVTNDPAADAGDKVKVRVTFSYKWISPFPGFIGSEALKICRATTMRYDPYRYGNGDPISGGDTIPSVNPGSPVGIPEEEGGGSPVGIPEGDL